MLNYTIKQLNENDWETYKRIRLEALKSDQQAFGSNYEENLLYDDNKWKERLKPFSENNKSITIALFDNDKCIGTTSFYSSKDKTAMIVGVYLNSNYRGKGLSKLLLKEIINIIKYKKEFNEIELYVNKDQISAVNLYKRFNFKIVSEEKGILGDGLEHTEYYMKLQL